MLIQRHKGTDMWVIVNYYYNMGDSNLLLTHSSIQQDKSPIQYSAEFSQQGTLKIVIDEVDLYQKLLPEEDLALFYNMVKKDGMILYIPILCNGRFT